MQNVSVYINMNSL